MEKGAGGPSNSFQPLLTPELAAQRGAMSCGGHPGTAWDQGSGGAGTVPSLRLAEQGASRLWGRLGWFRAAPSWPGPAKGSGSGVPSEGGGSPPFTPQFHSPSPQG